MLFSWKGHPASVYGQNKEPSAKVVNNTPPIIMAREQEQGNADEKVPKHLTET